MGLSSAILSRKPLLWLALFLAPLLLPPNLSAQSESGFSLAFGAHALTVPWHPRQVASHFNPAFLVGADRAWRRSDRWRLYFSVNLGAFRHRWWLSGISIEPEVGASRLLPGGVHADLSLGLGYMHYFWRRQPLELKDGRYVEGSDHGSPSLYLPLSAKVGYWGDPDRNPFLAPFVTARWGVQGLFQEEVPVVMHLQLLGGVRFGREGDAVGGRR